MYTYIIHIYMFSQGDHAILGRGDDTVGSPHRYFYSEVIAGGIIVNEQV